MSVGLVTIPANQLLPWEVNRNSTSPGLTSVYLLTFAVQLELTRGFMNNFFISQEDRSINADADTPELIQDFDVLKASEWDIFSLQSGGVLFMTTVKTSISWKPWV